MKTLHRGYYSSIKGKECKDERAILKDVDRTFPHLGFFDKNSKGYNILHRVLRALAIHMKDVGYCQGINFLAATIYLSTEDEEGTFWLLVHLLEEEKFKKIFSRGLKRYHLACYQLESLVRKHLPQLGLLFVCLCERCRKRQNWMRVCIHRSGFSHSCATTCAWKSHSKSLTTSCSTAGKFCSELCWHC